MKFIFVKSHQESVYDIEATTEIYNSVKELEELWILWKKIRKLYPKNEDKAFYFNSKFDLKKYPLILPFGGHIRYIPIKVLFNTGPVKTEYETLLISDKYELQMFKTTSEDTEIVKVLVDNLGNFTTPEGITGKILYNRKVYEDIVLLRKLVKKAWWYNLYLNFKKY